MNHAKISTNAKKTHTDVTLMQFVQIILETIPANVVTDIKVSIYAKNCKTSIEDRTPEDKQN